MKQVLRRTMKGAALGAGLLVLGVSVVPDAQARTRCSYSGPPTNVLSVTVSGSDSIGVITRIGSSITASEFLELPRPCTGGDPTVLNTDAINVSVGRGASLDVRLDRGPFAPGATPETEGASEIEIQIRGTDALADIIGTPRGDEFHWAPGGGLNLNPRSAGDRDVDVTVGGGDAFLIANGVGGDDTIVGAPGALVSDGVFSVGGGGNDVLRAPKSSDGILDGGPGNDTIVGGRGPDLLDGGAGSDRVAGGRGSDSITGGPGRDRLLGGFGRDSIRARDSARDTVNCGPGVDRITSDRRDRVRGCERVSRR